MKRSNFEGLYHHLVTFNKSKKKEKIWRKKIVPRGYATTSLYSIIKKRRNIKKVQFQGVMSPPRYIQQLKKDSPNLLNPWKLDSQKMIKNNNTLCYDCHYIININRNTEKFHSHNEITHNNFQRKHSFFLLRKKKREVFALKYKLEN